MEEIRTLLASMDSISFCSLNSRGHSPIIMNYVKSLLNEYHIVFLQEHWLYDDELNVLSNDLNDVIVLGRSGMECSELTLGRKYGGCACIVPQNSPIIVTPLDPPCSRRVFPCKVSLRNAACEYLVLVVYLPYEGGVHGSESFQDVLNCMQAVIETYDEVGGVFMCGDFNTDFARISPQTNALKRFCTELNLVPCVTLQVNEVDFTYVSDMSGSRSLIDHFIVSENLVPSVKKYFSLHEGNNTSDHSPVILELATPGTDAGADARQPCGNTRNPRPRWWAANAFDITVYKARLAENLSRVRIPPNEETAIQPSIDHYFDEIIYACVEAGMYSIPCNRPRARPVAGWSENVQHWKERSIFWSNLWRENGCPDNGVLYDIMKKAKHDYKRESRKVLRNMSQWKAERLAENLLNSQQRVFWKEVKRKRSKKWAPPYTVDGVNGEDEVCNLFMSKYTELYNSVSYDDSKMQELLRDVNADMIECTSGNCRHCMISNPTMNVHLVKKAISKLKHNKSDGSVNISSEHFLNACDELSVHLSMLFTLMLRNSYAPRDLLISKLKPIPKNLRKSVNDSNNYRSIALSSLVCKIFDNIILECNIAALQTSPLQFGFKPEHSTVMCSFLLHEIVECYNSSNSPVYMVMLDATKAFDRVEFIKLFNLLRLRNLCPSLIKLLLFMYTNQRMSVTWNNCESNDFLCTNGVKQGAVLSPILFCVYMDELLSRLSQSGAGCHMGHRFAGALSYADDLTLLAPSLHAARQLICICESFADEYAVKFNSSKSFLVVAQHKNENCNANLFLNGEKISNCTRCKYLGCYVGKNYNQTNVEQACKDLITRTNLLVSQFGKCSFDVKRKLFISFCHSFYGSPLWSLFDSDIQPIIRTWRKCVRFLLDLHPRTHSAFIAPVMDLTDFKFQLVLRFFRFYKKILTSKNDLLKYAASACLSHHSIVSNNIRFCMYLSKKNVSIFNDDSYNYSSFLNDIECHMPVISPEDDAHITVITDILNDLTPFNRFDNDTKTLLEYVCTN